MECIYNQSSFITLMRHPIIGHYQKAPYLSAFRWSPYGRLVSTGKHLETTRVVHLLKRTESEAGRSGPNPRNGPCRAGRA